VEQLHMMKCGDPHTLLIFIKFYIMEMRASLNKALPTRRSTVRMGERFSTMKMGERFSTTRAGEPRRSARRLTSQASQASFRSARSSGEVAAVWPGLDTELQKLTEIRKEVMNFSQLQVDKIDTVSQRLKASLLEAASSTVVRETPRSITSMSRTADLFVCKAPPGEAQPVLGDAAPHSSTSTCRTADPVVVEAPPGEAQPIRGDVAPHSSTSTRRTSDLVVCKAPLGEAQPESSEAAPRSGASMCGTVDLALCLASPREGQQHWGYDDAVIAV